MAKLFMKKTKRMKISKKIIAIIILFMLSSIISNNKEALAKTDSIGFEEAENIAKNFVECVVESGKNVGEWSDVLTIKKERTLYDANNDVSAYCIEYTNSNSDECGYIVVGANSNYAPIIEYATTGGFVETNRKLYYFGDEALDYYYAKDGKFQGVIEKNKYIRKDKMQEQLKKNNYENEWKGLESIEIENANSINTCKKNVENSNPPISGDVITNLDEYETNWISIAPIDCIKSNLRYFATYDFLGYNAHCAPTAGTNLLYYWYNRNNSKFSRLCYKNSWSQTFDLIYKYMKTDNSGTGEDDMRKGMKQYLNKVGYSSSEVKLISFPTWNDMFLEIDNGYGGYPFIFCVYDHYLYGNHAVLAVGYMEFEYKTKQASTKSKYSRYLRIADGWSNGAERFVHVTVGHDTSTKGMITVHPKAN